MTTKKRIKITDVKRVNPTPPAVEQALFPCEQLSAGIEELPDHYPDPLGYFPAEELRYLAFEVPAYESIFGGYWCPSCIEALNRKPGNTLAEDRLASIMRDVQTILNRSLP